MKTGNKKNESLKKECRLLRAALEEAMAVIADPRFVDRKYIAIEKARALGVRV